jgi:hypothetical protein
MIVQLEQVVFDHDAARAVVDGLSLRVDRSNAAAEWSRAAATRSPAAYALAPTTGQPVTIQAQFSFPDISDFSGPAVTIRARTADPDNAPFGAVDATVVPIPLSTINRVTPFVSMALAQVRLLDHGVGKYPITLRWQFQLEAGGPWVDFDASDHLVYVTLDLPGEPWAQRSTLADLLRVPWTRVLDWSCTWASGITIEDGNLNAAIARAAKRIERALYELGQRENVPVQYLDSGFAGAYATEYPKQFAFLCTKFLRLLAGDTSPEIDTLVDCSDCAAALVVFANVLGCDLSSSRIRLTDGASFDTNSVVSIGRKKTNSRSYPFEYHEVAVRGTPGAAIRSVRVFDACLMIDRDADPSTADKDHSFALSHGLTLATAALPPPTFRYVHRLIKQDDWPKLGFSNVPTRCLDECDAGHVAPVDPVTKDLFKDFFDLINVVAPPDPFIMNKLDLIPLAGYVAYHTNVETPHFAALGTLLDQSVDYYYVAVSDKPQMKKAVAGARTRLAAREVADDRKRSVTKAVTKAVVPDRRLRLSMGLASTPAKARNALAWVLAQSAVPLSLRTSDGKSIVGNAAFTGPRDGSVFFVRGNTIARLMNLGPSPAKLLDLARTVDLVVCER